MAVVYTKKDQGNAITTGTGAPVHSAVAGDRYTDTANGNTYQYTTSWQQVLVGSGLSFFTEAQNTTAPNATVPVDSLTAVSATTNADIAILPKGAGAFMVGHIPDGSIANGGKRGAGAVELMIGSMNYYAGATGTNAVAIGIALNATNTNSVAIGARCVSSGVGSVAIGNDIGSTTASGNGSVAMGGVNTTASGGSSTAFGGATASGASSFAVGYGNASGSSSVAMSGQIGGGAAASGNYSFALGSSTRATGPYSMAILWNSDTFSHTSRLSYGTYVNLNGSPASTPIGAVQGSTLVVGVDTNSVTPASLANYNGLAIALVLQNNNSIRFKGTIIARQTGSTNTSAWDIDGFIQRGTTAATTTLLISNINVVENTPAWTTPTLTANTATGGLDIKVTGIASTLLRWTCVLTTTEVIIA